MAAGATQTSRRLVSPELKDGKGAGRGGASFHGGEGIVFPASRCRTRARSSHHFLHAVVHKRGLGSGFTSSASSTSAMCKKRFKTGTQMSSELKFLPSPRLKPFTWSRPCLVPLLVNRVDFLPTQRLKGLRPLPERGPHESGSSFTNTWFGSKTDLSLTSRPGPSETGTSNPSDARRAT